MSAESKTLARVETFSDGVFAIACTLLVLELKVPSAGAMHSASELWHALVNNWPSYFAFSFSFGMIIIAWINHHHFMSYIHKCNRPFMYANALLLFTACLIPYPTAVLAEHLNTPNVQAAVFFYTLAVLFHNFAWNVLAESAMRPHKLVKEGFEKIYLKDKRYSYIAFVIYCITATLAWWFPITALIINIILWLLWIGFSISDKEL